MKKAFATPVLVRLAQKAGVKVIMEPRYKYAGMIVLPSGKKSYFRGTCFDLNPLGASEIAIDKDYCNYFLKYLGYPTISGQAFFTTQWAKAIKSNKNPEAAFRYARRLGLPVMVKPNSLSQGSGVTKVYNRKEFFEAVKNISKGDRVFLVQKIVSGKDYRIVVLDGKIISVYERLALKIVGDGKSTIKHLLNQKQKSFVTTGRDTTINFKDFRMFNRLKRFELNLASVLKPGQEFELLDNRNLSSGGDAVEMTNKIHPSFRKLCVRLVKDMGLKYCGLDLMVKGSIAGQVRKYYVIELNAAPGIDNYANVGSKQKQLVEDMYLRVLKAIAKGAGRT